MVRWNGWLARVAALSAMSWGGLGPARAQEPGAGSRENAAVVVEGTVREVFRSARRDRVDVLVQVEVKRSEAGRVRRDAPRIAFPAPGDMVYIHTSERPGASPPRERAQVRVFLAPRSTGGWEGASLDWFEPTSNELAAEAPGDPMPPADRSPSPTPTPTPTTTPKPNAPATPGRSSLPALGLSGEGQTVQGQFVFRVASVDRGGPAQRAGLEVGDVIVAANERPLSGIDQLTDLSRKGGTLSLVVLDVNTGKGARVAVELGAEPEPGPQPPIAANNRPAPAPAPLPPPSPSPSPTPAPAPAPGEGRKKFGVSAEPVTIGSRTAMKVVRVTPGSPAALAGIEVGDVIVAINDVPITGAESMSSVLKKSGPTLRVKVRDTRSGREVEVEAAIGGPPAPTSPVAPTTTAEAPRPSGGGGRLGVVGEIVFSDTEPAVKVAEVVPESPAARAGVQPGFVILEANGTPILHPNTLNEVVAKSGTTVKLSVIDPRTNRRGTIEVNLSAGR